MPVPVQAGEVPLTGPVPDWVAPAPELDARLLGQDAATVPLFDEQNYIDGDLAVAYVDAAQTVANAEQLNRLGTISASWQPAHGDLTIHRIEILRGAEKFDLMKDGPGFTVLRREAGLERMIIDGTLTATRQIQGLRIGDTLRFAFSISGRDSVLGGRAQSATVLFAKPVKIGFGRARLVWPAAQKIAWKALLPGITATPRAISGGRKELTIPLPLPALPEIPRDAPARFKPVPMIVATNFSSWAEVASTMAPLYRPAGAIMEGSDLARATDAILAAHADPVERMAEALHLVQDSVRYQLIAMGTGNYAPQQPAKTWDMRYGDCKAKSLLLLAMLDRLGIKAEAVLANIETGDLVPRMLPAPLAFDHVIVRAEVAGESFWLDGTSTGVRLADIRDVPRFGHVLPLRDKGAELLQLPVRANARPALDLDLAYDGTAGVHLPMPFALRIRYAGAYAEQQRANAGASSEDALVKIAETTAKKWTDSETIAKPTATYDPKDSTWTLDVEGVAYPDWQFNEGRLEFGMDPTIRIDFKPDRSRSTWQALPALIDKPWTARSRVAYRLPREGAEAALEGGEPLKLALPAVEFERTARREGTTIVEEVVSRETGVEVAAGEVSAAKKAIADANAKVLRIVMPASYPQRWDDVARMKNSPAAAKLRGIFDRRIADKPDAAERHSDRGWLNERMFDWAAAETDFTRAIALDPSAARYLRRARLRVTRGDETGSLKDAQTAYDLDPGNKDIREQLAAAFSRSGKTDQALDLIEANPDVASEDGEGALLSRVEVLVQGGRAEEALALLDAALAKRASSAALLNGRCWFKALTNTDLAGALADCSRAIEISGEPSTYFDSRAMVHFRAGRAKEAIQDLDSALAIEPELAASRFMRGIIASREGKRRKAPPTLPRPGGWCRRSMPFSRGTGSSPRPYQPGFTALMVFTMSRKMLSISTISNPAARTLPAVSRFIEGPMRSVRLVIRSIIRPNGWNLLPVCSNMNSRPPGLSTRWIAFSPSTGLGTEQNVQDV